MSHKFLLSASFLGVLLLSGCAGFDRRQGAAEYATLQEPAPMETAQTCPSAQYPDAYDTKCAAEDEFVNYTKVAADYREFGERSPRDYMVVDGSAGSNMSATIPPSVEGEVVDYEETSGKFLQTYFDLKKYCGTNYNDCFAKRCC